MEVLKCPSCGNPDLERGSGGEYRCAYCGARFVLTSPVRGSADAGLVDVVLLSYPAKQQINVIKALREATRLGLADAKRATDALPAVVARDVPAAEGQRIQARLEAAGATVQVRPR